MSRPAVGGHLAYGAEELVGGVPGVEEFCGFLADLGDVLRDGLVEGRGVGVGDGLGCGGDVSLSLVCGGGGFGGLRDRREGGARGRGRGRGER
ncbi:hypothetical protein RB200_19685 [Streptomyces sp. PmtG]